MACRDGTRIPITEKCICGTNDPFWKPVEDTQNKLKQDQCCKKRKNALGDIWIVTITKRNHYNVKIYLYNYNTLNIVNKN